MVGTKDYSVPQPGDRFGRLTVVSSYLRDCGTYRKSISICKCDCGNTTECFVNSLRRKNNPTTSCGCFQKERASQTKRIHGQSGTHLNGVWATMISRCHNKNVASYQDYGAHGISVCPTWRDSFAAFSEWATQAGYAKGLEIDRIDNTAGYSPENCRWVTRKINANNKSSSHIIECDGKTMTIAQWSELLNVPYTRIIMRIRRGWSVREALFAPKVSR